GGGWRGSVRGRGARAPARARPAPPLAPPRGGAPPHGTPLCAAACWGHTDVVRELLAHGADPGLREERGSGRTPLEWALAGPYPETVALLSAALEPSVPLDAQRQ
ncbi:ankyrin repeat domain-containing protein, partial [Streptomyces sp. NPDC059477]|uniref:ankyrin repeat domain-containing protein n=1 Tax=Streptomyces sp. NPDC059477 TaxID=3346847 RepID=UPI00368ED7E7